MPQSLSGPPFSPPAPSLWLPFFSRRPEGLRSGRSLQHTQCQGRSTYAWNPMQSQKRPLSRQVFLFLVAAMCQKIRIWARLRPSLTPLGQVLLCKLRPQTYPAALKNNQQVLCGSSGQNTATSRFALATGMCMKRLLIIPLQ